MRQRLYGVLLWLGIMVSHFCTLKYLDVQLKRRVIRELVHNWTNAKDCVGPVHPNHLSSQCPSICSDLDFGPDLSEDRWLFRNAKRPLHENAPCSTVRPSPKDVVRRFYSILPFLDKDHSNTAFLHKFRGTVYGMAVGEDLLDREGAYYAAILTPLVMLQQYRDMWCLLERFHRALCMYQISHPTEKRSALKLLQNFRAVNQKVRSFISDLPGPTPLTTTYHTQEPEDEELHYKKDSRYLKELIKNLG